MYAATETHPQLARQAWLQRGVLHRDQFRALGLSRHFVSAQISASRWTSIGENVVLLQNAPPDRRELMWIAVLDAGPVAALGSHTALELAGFESFATEANDIHLVVPRGRHVTPVAGVTVHESRRISVADIRPIDRLPCTGVARSVLDAAAWQPYPRFACVMVAAAVQQRLVSAEELDDTMRTVGRIRHKAYLRMAIAEAVGGAQAIGELDLAVVCRRFDLAPPRRQVKRSDAAGRIRYHDAEWDLPGGQILVLEVDGGHHRDAVHWETDMRRERAIVVSGRKVLRCTNFELRAEPRLIVADLLALGVPRRSELSALGPAIAS